MPATLLTVCCPPYASSEHSAVNLSKSPFRSLNNEIYLYRDIECTERERNRLAQQNLKIYEKSTISSRARSRKAVKKLEAAFERDTRATIEKETSGPNWALTFAKCCQSDKQSVIDYINEQKELFLLEYAVKIKQYTIRRLENLAAKEEKKALIAETKIEEDTFAFEEFLKENDRSSVNALKIATEEAKAKMELTADVKSAIHEVFTIKSEMTNCEDVLRQYLSYEMFLLSVSPKEWQDQQFSKKKKKREKYKRLVSQSFPGPAVEKKLPTSSSFSSRSRPYNEYGFFRKVSKQDMRSCKPTSGDIKKSVQSGSSDKSFCSEDEYSIEDIDSDVEPEIYFKNPEDLLKIFTYLEEQNLSLFQNIQELSETLEELGRREQFVTQHMSERIKTLLDEKETLLAACIKEEEKSAELASKANMFSTGFNSAHMDKLLKTLNKKVTDVYKVCCETEEVTNLTTFQMLKTIEMRVSELCEMLETVSKEFLDAIEVTEKLRAKERRKRAREEKLNELKRIQEERLKNALERAIAAPKKRIGRKLVYRSQPPESVQGEEHFIDLATKSEDDYYFA